MERVISVSLGEVVLKGLNRKYFEDKLIKNMRKVLKGLGDFKIYKEQGKLYIEGIEHNEELAIKRLKYVFGLVYISRCFKTDNSMESVKLAAYEAIKEKLQDSRTATFKVETSRSDKRYPLKSPEISREVGGYILSKFGNLRVDVHNPDIMLYIDMKSNAYIYITKEKAYGGLPVGTNGKAMLLLSGGIDSPVAGFLMAKRGVEIECIHFHSYPFTSERAENKVLELAKIISRYTGRVKVTSINLLNIQKAINEKCKEDEMTIISRRFMMRIAEKLANKSGCNALVTGENLGQVASQTIYSMDVINQSVDMLILRPLAGMDKVDIIEWSKRIETYETSILPFEDCCTVFLPKHPVTKPKKSEIELSESVLDISTLVEESLLSSKEYVFE